MTQNTFVTSDIHFGHANIIRYCNRPFKSVEDMDEAIIARWNSRVTNEDLVYFLGDFAFTNQDRIKELFTELNFAKCIIVPGNHDREIMSMWHHPINPFIPRVTVTETIENLRVDGKRFVLCHYPIADWDGKFHGSVHLHGHSHTEFAQEAVQDMISQRRYDIGVDMYGGPVRLTGDLRYLNSPKGWQQ